MCFTISFSRYWLNIPHVTLSVLFHWSAQEIHYEQLEIKFSASCCYFRIKIWNFYFWISKLLWKCSQLSDVVTRITERNVPILLLSRIEHFNADKFQFTSGIIYCNRISLVDTENWEEFNSWWSFHLYWIV